MPPPQGQQRTCCSCTCCIACIFCQPVNKSALSRAAFANLLQMFTPRIQPRCQLSYWTCYSCTGALTGSLPVGECFFLPGAGTSDIHITILQVWPKHVLQFRPGCLATTFPLTELLLCMFIAHLGAENLAHQRLKCYISATHYLSVT